MRNAASSTSPEFLYILWENNDKYANTIFIDFSLDFK